MQPLPTQQLRRPGRDDLILALVLMVAAANLVTGCSRREPDVRSSPAVTDRLANGLRREEIPGLDPWFALWQTAVPGLVADSLQFGGMAPALRGGFTQPLSDFDSLSFEERAAFEALTARSSDGRYRLIFDRYQAISEEDGAVEISGEPDSAPLLIDEGRRLVHTFEFCGTPCGYDWGTWVDSVRFALGGWTEVDAAQDSLRGTLAIYSLQDSTVIRYHTRPVSADEYANYRRAWQEWVTGRYRKRRSMAVHGD